MDTRTTFKVKVWSIRPLKRAHGTHYQVRWFLDGEEHNETFPKAKAADSFRSMLVAAVGKGEAFAFVTGLPLSHPKTVMALTPPAVAIQSVLELATSFVDRKWGQAAPTYRVDIAKAMTAVTTAMLSGPLPAGFSATEVRTALRSWQFAASRRAETPSDFAKIVAWVGVNTRPVKDLDDPHTFETFFTRVTSRIDGKPMAASSYKRYRAILNNFLSYCVRLKQLETHPLRELDTL